MEDGRLINLSRDPPPTPLCGTQGKLWFLVALPCSRVSVELLRFLGLQIPSPLVGASLAEGTWTGNEALRAAEEPK